MLGFAAGVMIAAQLLVSTFTLTAIEMSEGGSLPVWAPPAIGFLLGGSFFY